MSKYEPLTQFLARNGAEKISLTFEDIEKLIGAKLPGSASKYRAWWSNNPSNSVMTKAWLDAGYVSKDVSLAERKLVFQKMAAKIHPGAGGAVSQSAPVHIQAARAVELIGCLKGTVTVKLDVDLAAPADAGWGAMLP